MQPVLWLAFCLVLAAAQKGLQPPRLKAGKSAFTGKLARGGKASGKARVSLAVSATENVELDLEPNTELVSTEYEEYEITSTGEKKTLRSHKDITPCWYKGTVVGDPNSVAIVTDCDGFEGFVKRSNGRHFVATSVDGKDQVAVYAKEDEEVVPGGCGTVDEHGHQDASHHHGAPSAPPAPADPAGRRLLDYSNTVNVVEVALFSDFGYLQAFGGDYGRNLSAIASRNIQLMNIARAIYEATNFARATTIKLKAQFFFSAGDPYTMTTDVKGEVNSSVLLSRFRSFALTQNYAQYDHLHLLSHFDFDGSTIGLAYVSSACSNYQEGTTMTSMSLGQTADTFAHELGHTLGMSHDGKIGPPDTTACPATGSLMAASSSCPSTGLCPISSCSIASKDNYTAGTTCLFTWTNPACNDGIWNGNETGVDCGGSCPACIATGCQNNNGGCSDTCTPLGGTDFVCSCKNSSWYVDPADGLTCVGDIDQCQDFRCQDGCVNLIGPGDSFYCTCTPPNQLSLFDHSSCLPPSCNDRIRNQDEVMVDCGGVCSRPCQCFQSSVSFLYPEDYHMNLNGARWQMWDNTGLYATYKDGVPVRYVYLNATAATWVYDFDNDSTYYWGVVDSTSSIPYSGIWQMYNGTSFVNNQVDFVSCSSVASTCGNGVVEGREECDTCLNFTGGQCVTPNTCCTMNCTAHVPRGTACSFGNLKGSCWDGGCVTRAASCALHTAYLNCFGTGCLNFTGGEACEGVQDPVNFPSAICTDQFYCYKTNCAATDLTATPPIGPTRGFPCSALGADGRYPRVCDGGTDGAGSIGSACVSVDSLTNYATLAPSTKRPTPPTGPRPSALPTMASLAPTSYPTFQPALSATGALYPSLLMWTITIVRVVFF